MTQQVSTKILCFWGIPANGSFQYYIVHLCCFEQYPTMDLVNPPVAVADRYLNAYCLR
jgi:hypothetical protein